MRLPTARRHGLPYLTPTLLLLFAFFAPACGSAQVTTVDAGPLPPITPPPLSCSTTASTCTCAPLDATTGPAPATCDDTLVPHAHCCTGTDYPYAGDCTCSARGCDGSATVSSCSSPPAIVEAGVCDPATCGGSSCAGGYCCTSACVNGACEATCH